LSDLLTNQYSRRSFAAPPTDRVPSLRRFRFRSGSPAGGPHLKITFVWALHLMVPFARDIRADNIVRIGTQPIALAAATLLVILAGLALIVLWRAYLGTAPPEPERTTVSARQLQMRTAQASEQLVAKTKGLEATQQESIDQLQMVQDQLQTVRRLLAAQQADTRRLSEQVSSLTEAIAGLRQSYASAQASESSSSPAIRNRSVRNRAHATVAADKNHPVKSTN
jgi:hypothetical protein